MINFIHKYVLTVEYGTGKMSVITEQADLILALQEFVKEYQSTLPDTEMYGLPPILKAEISPLAYFKEDKKDG